MFCVLCISLKDSHSKRNLSSKIYRFRANLIYCDTLNDFVLLSLSDRILTPGQPDSSSEGWQVGQSSRRKASQTASLAAWREAWRPGGQQVARGGGLSSQLDGRMAGSVVGWPAGRLASRSAEWTD